MLASGQSEWIASAAVQRIVGIKRNALDALKNAGVIEERKGKIKMDDVEVLNAWKKHHHYVTGKGNVDFSRPFGFAVPLTDPNLSPNLELSEKNSADDARRGLRNQGITLGENQILSGWWSCQQNMVDRLIAANAPILGITGGFITTGGYIDGLALTHPVSARRAFIVTRMTDTELEKYRGVVGRMNQSGTYVQLPSVS